MTVTAPEPVNAPQDSLKLAGEQAFLPQKILFDEHLDDLSICKEVIYVPVLVFL